MIQAWFIHDTFIMHFRYKLWQRNIFSFIFLDRSFDFRWILLMVSLSICYIYDTSLLHSWFLHDTFIRSLNENDSIVNEWTSNLFTLRIKQWVTFLMTFYVMFILRLWQVFFIFAVYGRPINEICAKSSIVDYYIYRMINISKEWKAVLKIR